MFYAREKNKLRIYNDRIEDLKKINDIKRCLNFFLKILGKIHFEG